MIFDKENFKNKVTITLQSGGEVREASIEGVPLIFDDDFVEWLKNAFLSLGVYSLDLGKDSEE